MDAKTLEALKASIAKWERNADEARATLRHDEEFYINLGWKQCDLCRLFFHYLKCAGCPVHDRTGKISCYGTPYYSVRELAIPPGRKSSAELVAACEAEVAFLRSLLPAEG